MLLRTRPWFITRSFSKSKSASECCQVQRLKRVRSLADERPDLDFDYLLDHENLNSIKKNIENRKGIGDIDKVHHIWDTIQRFGEKKKGSAEEYSKLWHEFYTEALKIPNRTHQDAPVGGESDNIVVETVGKRREGSGLFIAEDLVSGWRSVHYPREAAGSRAYAFIGPLANIEHALLSFAVDTVRELKPDIKVMQVPDLLPLTSTQGCGVLPKSVDDHTLQYLVGQDPQICLSGTAEMGIAHLLKNTTLTGQKSHWFLAKSRCYRPEVSHSAAEAKLYRVHEFNKVEMFVVCEWNDSDKCLKEIVDIQKEIFGRLGFHYRVLDMASQELGAAAARKFDIEAWMPGRKYFGEVSSASNCFDYQSRRLGIKIKSSDGEIKYAHTCNGTAISSSRALITVLESHQEKDRKSWKCPEALQKYMPSTRAAPVFLKKARKFTYDFTD